MSRHADRRQLATDFGATDIVAERGDEGIERIMELTGGIGPDLMRRVLEGQIQPGKAFDLTLPMSEVAEAYAAMDERRAIKTLLRP